jgi:hypothetical protein
MAGFDCEDIYREHAFLVSIPKKASDPIAVWEVFGRAPTAEEREWQPEILLRANLARERWDLVSAEVRQAFNRRLKAEGKKVGRWSPGENAVQRLLGKELLVLVWAVEQDVVDAEAVSVAVKNWLGLKPEERWWLYTMTAASTGFAHQAGQGWRAALRHALCFGTGKDLFGLGALTERGALSPRANPDYAAPVRTETPTGLRPASGTNLSGAGLP